MSSFSSNHSTRSLSRYASLFIALAISVFASSLRAEDAPIKIGAYASLTGKEANWGQSYQRGVRLAEDELNASGGVLGRKVEVIMEDDQSKAGESATSVRKLITRDKVVAICGEISSGRSLEAAPVCQQLKVPMISSGSNPKVTETGNYIFRIAFIDPFQGTVMAVFCQKKLGVHRVALLVDVTSAYSVSLAKYFKERFVADGGTILLEQKYSGGEKDFKAQLTAIKAANPEALFVPGYYTEAGLIVAQARQIGITVPLTGGDGWSAPQLVETAGAALDNTYFCDAFANEFEYGPTQAFIKKYRERYKIDPDSVAPHGFDAVMFVADAIRRSSSTDSAKVRDAMAVTKQFPGSSGEITVDGQRNVTKPGFIMTVKDGHFKFVEAVMP